MLSIRKTVTLSGSTIVDKKNIEGYQATIDSRNPEGITFSVFQQDAAACKINRQECRRNYAEFQDVAYVEQDAMIEEIKQPEDQ